MDLFPTALALAGAKLPTDRPIDGTDITGVLTNGATLPERPFFYYRGPQLFACRLGNFKAHFQTQAGYGQAQPEKHATPLLFDVAIDPSERFDIAAKHPDVIERVNAARNMMQRYGHPSTLLLVQIENLNRISTEFGPEAAEA